MLTRRREPGRPDHGFTLIELLLSVAILGLIGAALASSFLVMLSTQQRTEESQAVSQDRQLVPVYFVDDVAGAREVATGVQSVCGSSIATVLTLRGRDYAPGSTTAVSTTVAYRYDPPRLTRVACRDGGSASTTSLARNVVAAPTVSGSCSSTTPVTSSPSPRTVALTVPQAQGDPLVLCSERRPE